MKYLLDNSFEVAWISKRVISKWNEWWERNIKKARKIRNV